MINTLQVQKYCKDEISKIENYDKAIADTVHTWDLHHRLELTLDGEFAHSRDELKRLGMYYQRPYFELIFLTNSEHHRLHAKYISDETRRKLSDAIKGDNHPFYGKHHTEESRKKMSDAKKGEKSPFYGKHLSEETRKKLSETMKARWARRRAADT